MMDLVFLVIATEAITELIFRAGPLQPAREWLIVRTPWLSTEAQGHLLECKYCTSFWIGIGLFGIHDLLLDKALFLWFIYAVSVPRLANFLHLPFSLLRDRQLNLRIDRNRRG
jgi:hypothetical protein